MRSPEEEADKEVRSWLSLADRVMQGDELGERDWTVLHWYLSGATDWAGWMVKRQEGVAPKRPTSEDDFARRVARKLGVEGRYER